MSSREKIEEDELSTGRRSCRNDLHQQQIAENLINDYNKTIISQNTRSIIIWMFVVFVMFSLLKILAFACQSLVIHQAEITYLQELTSSTENLYHHQIEKMQQFYWAYRALSGELGDLSQTGSASCSSQMFDCGGQVPKWAQNLLEYEWDLISKLTQSILLDQNKHSATKPVIMLSWELTWYLSLNFDFLAEDSNWPEMDLLSSIDDPSKNSYIFQELNLMLLCGVIQDNLYKICVMSQFIVEGHALGTDNVVSQVEGSIQEEAEGISRLVSSFYSQSNRNSYLSAYRYQQCLERYEKNSQYTQNMIQSCHTPSILSALSPITLFSTFSLSMPKQNKQITFHIFSNQTFFKNHQTRVSRFCFEAELSVQLFCVVAFIWIMLLPISARMIGLGLCPLIALVMKMGKAIRQIDSKEQLDRKLQTFNNLVNQLPAKGESCFNIFGQTVKYFNYLIWYRKWLIVSKISRKKELIKQGLDLFNKEQFAEVLVYIYRRQIQRQTITATNLKKLRSIFNQRMVLYKNQPKFDSQKRINKGHRRGVTVKQIQNQANSQSAQNYETVTDRSKGEVEDGFDLNEYGNFNEEELRNYMKMRLQTIQLQKKNKRSVRFSHDLQNFQPMEDKQVEVSRFMLSLPSQSSIVKSSQSIEGEIRKRDEQQNTNQPDSSNMQQRQTQQARILESEQSEWNKDMIHLKFDQASASNSSQSEDDCLEFKSFSYRKVDAKLCKVYNKLMELYDSMIDIQTHELSLSEIQSSVIAQKLYVMEIEKLRFSYKYIKCKNKQIQKKIKELNRKLITVKKERNLDRDLAAIANDRTFGSERKIQSTISGLEEEIMEEGRFVDVEFKNFVFLEENFKINSQLVEKASLYQIKVLKIMNYPIPYKQVECLCESNDDFIKVQARCIMAAEFFQISPHADLEILTKVHEILNPEIKTTHTQKRKALQLIKRVLKNREGLGEESETIDLMRNFYNYHHKKLYFVADISDNYEIFQNVLEKIYGSMAKTDLYQIFNLAMNDIRQDMLVTGSELKPTKFHDFDEKFSNFHADLSRVKSLGSSKMGFKRMLIEKDFRQILKHIHEQSISIAKYLVVFLGGETQTQSKTNDEYETSSAHNRQKCQAIHQDILQVMEKAYFHVILVGFNLRDYSTKQGKIKKYSKHCHDLLEIDLSKGSANCGSIQKYLHTQANVKK